MAKRLGPATDKFDSEDESNFWKEVYLTSMKAGKSAFVAGDEADIAVKAPFLYLYQG